MTLFWIKSDTVVLYFLFEHPMSILSSRYFHFSFKLTEVPLPVRFIFIYLVPEDWRHDVTEVGRTMGTLLSNPVSPLCQSSTNEGIFFKYFERACVDDYLGEKRCQATIIIKGLNGEEDLAVNLFLVKSRVKTIDLFIEGFQDVVSNMDFY